MTPLFFEDASHISVDFEGSWPMKLASQVALCVCICMMLCSRAVCGVSAPSLDDADLQKKAAAGVPSAERMLGIAYSKAARPDIGKFKYWLTRAIGDGDTESEVVLGSYIISAPINQNEMKSAEAMLLDASSKNFPDAYLALGRLYYSGASFDGIPQDRPKANAYFARAVEEDTPRALRGDEVATSDLISIYSHGYGVASNAKMATFFALVCVYKGLQGANIVASKVSWGLDASTYREIDRLARLWKPGIPFPALGP